MRSLTLSQWRDLRIGVGVHVAVSHFAVSHIAVSHFAGAHVDK